MLRRPSIQGVEKLKAPIKAAEVTIKTTRFLRNLCKIFHLPEFLWENIQKSILFKYINFYFTRYLFRLQDILRKR